MEHEMTWPWTSRLRGNDINEVPAHATCRCTFHVEHDLDADFFAFSASKPASRWHSRHAGARFDLVHGMALGADSFAFMPFEAVEATALATCGCAFHVERLVVIGGLLALHRVHAVMAARVFVVVSDFFPRRRPATQPTFIRSNRIAMASPRTHVAAACAAFVDLSNPDWHRPTPRTAPEGGH
ncbi:hypothetical protein LXT21_32215 [Myxococcus sp. K38C18041901]|uniref:hypothetical protein n=1 Tax=Myxococcus guangdongensis TaxID=2906760 RepID=UPI0020A7E328|nr:hypothetical protein [Myxococcus guangdongensis]MCP3063453.1 hypothetical protein [Myxococcus guangdongensis]